MRKTKVKLLRKNIVLSFAVLLLTAGSVYAASSWGDLQNDVNNAQEGSNVITIDTPLTTDASAPLNFGAPPVPITIKGGGNTITAQTVGANTTSQIIVNSSANTNKVIIQDTNLKGGVGNTGGAIQNAGGSGTADRTAGGDITIEGTGGNRVEVSGNTAGKGGAIYNLGTITINNVDFSDNHAVDNTEMPNNDGTFGRGGVIFNGNGNIAGTVNISNSTFTNNSSTSAASSAYSGVIHNRLGQVIVENTQFGLKGDASSGNSAATSGGAVLNIDYFKATDSGFNYNQAIGTAGGAIMNGLDSADVGMETDAVLILNNTEFNNNYANVSGGAIHNFGSLAADHQNIAKISDGSSFTNNGISQDGTKYTQYGGAIYNNGKGNGANASDAVLQINTEGTGNRTVVFENNIASANGGAVFNSGVAQINNTLFKNNGISDSAPNTITNHGGAIYNANTALGGAGSAEVSNSTFQGNTAQYGGAIYNESQSTAAGTQTPVITIKDSDFIGNKAVDSATGAVQANRGGAIYATSNTKTNLIAENKNVNIGEYGTSLNNGHDTIKLVGNAELNLESQNSSVINLNSTVYGDSRTTNINVNGGQINVNAPIKDSTININEGMIKFEHDRYLAGKKELVDTAALNNVVLNGGTLNLLNNEFVDQLQANSLSLTKDSNIMLDVDLANEQMDSILKDNFTGGITVDGDSKLNVSEMKSVSEAIGNNATILFTDAPALIGHVTNNGASVIEAPINKYAVTHVTQSAGTGSPLGPDYIDGEYFQFSKLGNSDSAISGPVAAQAAFLIMDNLYRQSFANMDMVTLMSPEERMAWKMRNKYASTGYHTGVYAPNVIPEERDGWYMRPFSNFENVPLKNGPRVSNVSYGTLIGGESDIIDLGHGWDGNFSLFGAYHGSHQAYNGVGIWQNGGTFGGVATAYKGNFWTGVTANVGASAARASHAFGSDDFPILMTGAAWKSGYNWGLLKNKLIIQPSYMMSYTFVNVFDYTNAAGVKISQDPLNAIEIIPGLRIIGNLKNGWQPYLGFNMTWNIMDKTKFYANEVMLEQLSVKPYFEYGVGLQKRHGDRFTGFGQAMLRSGGRNGVALTLGFRWALGH